jgi:outer membrane protein assembly complex protein YaeT
MRLCGIRLCKVLLLLLCPLGGDLLARPSDFEGKPIAVITFDPRQQPIPPAEMAQILPLKMKEPLRMADVRAAIERLYATGRYADIAVEAELRNGEVVLRIFTKGNWFVGRVSVEGVPAPPSRSQLINATQLDLGNPFLEEDVQTAVEDLQETLRRNGFYEVRIEPRFEYERRTQQVDIRFVVEPGKRDRFGVPIIHGNPQRPARKITGATKWKGWFGWKPVTETRVQRGLERIRRSYQKRDHLMAQVSMERLDHIADKGRAIPNLTLEAGPLVQIETSGENVSRGRLKRLVPVYEERSVDRDLLVEGARNLTEHFQAKGYFDTRVRFTTEPVNAGRQRIVYEIDRGRRHKLVRLEIRGNRYFDLMTIRERMYITSASVQFRRGRFSENLLRRDLDAIADLYRANGFRDVALTSEVQDDYRGKQGAVAVLIEIREGSQWFVANLALSGIQQEDEQTIRSMIQSAPGQPFSQANVAADRDNILAYYYNGGYPSASFEWSYQPSSKPNQVDLAFTISEGARQFVREVLINGYDATQPQLVHRRILLNPGEPISQARILETQRRLYDLGIFAKVDTAIQNPEGDEQFKYVLFQLEESRKYSVTGGFGAEIARIGGSQTSFESPAGEADFSPRVSFNFSRLNFTGRGHTISFRSRLSTIQRRTLASYIAPQFRGNDDLDLSFTALFDDSRDVRTFQSRRWEGAVQFAHRWTRSKTLFYRFAYRRVSVDVDTLKIRPELIPLLSQPIRVGMVSGGYVDDRRDDPTDSRKGTYNQLDLGVASRMFGSQADFFRLLGRNSTYHPIGRKLVLARTLAFGWMQTLRTKPELPPEEQDIPLPERFFAGGASTHRGFPENQAGPRDPVTGFPLGGKASLMAGTELRFPLFGENIGGVLFHDAGNVYSRIENVSFRVRQRDNTDFDYMMHAIGFGIRYRTPIGPIRVDFAFTPNSPEFFGFKGTREELLFGGGVQTQQRISRFQFHFSLGQTF